MTNRIDSLREYVAMAAAGVSIGAALMIVVPVELMRAAGLENAEQGVAIKTAVLAAAVSLAARMTRINIHRK